MNAIQLPLDVEIATALANLDEAGFEYEIVCSGDEADRLTPAA